MLGIDCTSSPPIAALQAAGVAFVCRYVGYFSGYNDNDIAQCNQGKCLCPSEALTLSKGGLLIVSNYEWYESRPTEGFNAGAWDATMALKIHNGCGGPSSAPIYFSVDTDVDGASVAAYFQGVISILGLARTGAYGSYRVIKYLFDNKLISFGWQTYAWSNGQWEPRAQLQQYQNGMQIGGVSVDYDRSMAANYGGWFIPVATYQDTALRAEWGAVVPNAPQNTGIFWSWYKLAQAGQNYGPPISLEEYKDTQGNPLTTWDGTTCSKQYFGGGWCEWVNNVANWYKYT